MTLVSAMSRTRAEDLCRTLAAAFAGVRFAVAPRSEEIYTVVCEHDLSKPSRKLIESFVDGYIAALADVSILKTDRSAS
jgi:hypothetical protein